MLRKLQGLSLLIALVLIGALVATFIQFQGLLGQEGRTFVWVVVVCVIYLLIMRAFDEAQRRKVEDDVALNKEILTNSIVSQTNTDERLKVQEKRQ